MMERHKAAGIGKLDRLCPGDIVFVRKGGPDPVGWFIRKQEGDFNWNHVCLVGGDGATLWTTGARGLVVYGAVSAQAYLANKDYAIGRLVGLETQQCENILAAASSLNGNIYPAWSLVSLILLGFRGEQLKRTGATICERPRHFICSQAVAWCINKAYGLDCRWRDGLILNPRAGKEDCTAYTPETIYYHEGLQILSP